MTYDEIFAGIEPKRVAAYLKTTTDMMKRQLHSQAETWPAEAIAARKAEHVRLLKVINDLGSAPTPLEDAINKKGAR